MGIDEHNLKRGSISDLLAWEEEKQIGSIDVIMLEYAFLHYRSDLIDTNVTIIALNKGSHFPRSMVHPIVMITRFKDILLHTLYVTAC